jgi:hypothetical protein
MRDKIVILLMLFAVSCGNSEIKKEAKIKNLSGDLINVSTLVDHNLYVLIDCPDSNRLKKNEQFELTVDHEKDLQAALSECNKSLNEWLESMSKEPLEIKVDNLYKKAKYLDSFVPTNNIVDNYIIETHSELIGIKNLLLFVKIDTYDGKVYGEMWIDGKVSDNCEAETVYQSYSLM